LILADDAGWESLTPAKVVEMLDCHIVGQRDAKRAVAVALRMRFQPLV
jgi:ATP-dependent protease HslVU (ClpYQ) ATPase subunit